MEKRTLLQKYDIPISHLDFDYIKECKDIKELEKIVSVLRSGEEGFYPELTKCAEDKLKELNPQSRALRTEERMLTKHSFSAKDWDEHSAPIAEWSTEIKNKDSILSTIQKIPTNDIEIIQPPIRKSGKVDVKKIKENIQEIKETSAVTNYDQWDKYDADAEILKMDLKEERAREQVERMNRTCRKKWEKNEAIDEKSNIYARLSSIEREKLSEDYRIRGNEYFKLKEYDHAFQQYSRSIKVQPSAPGYNNRAIANLKLKRYADALSDCDECLKRDPSNLKALLRKAEAFLGLEQKIDAFQTYEHIKLIEPENAIACKAMQGLHRELGDVAPIHATRLQIMESNVSKDKTIVKVKPVKPPVDYDFAELIKPKNVVKNSFMKTMENFGKLTPKAGEKTDAINHRAKPPQVENSQPEFRLQIEDPNAMARRQEGKLLIEEL